MTVIRVAIVGLGKIARDQHISAIAETAGIELAATVSRNASINGIRHFATLDELLDRVPDIDAVALCTPPQGRQAQAAAALKAGKPGSAEFRAALRDALENGKQIYLNNGLSNMSPTNHNGYDERSAFLIKVEGGKFRLVK